MSAQRDAAADTGPERPAPDPHGLLDGTPFDSMREAERRAERTTNPRCALKCPACDSINIVWVREPQTALRRHNRCRRRRRPLLRALL